MAANPTEKTGPLVGAHYYLWYPGNLGAGTLRNRLVPKGGPSSAYRSDDPAQAEQAISAAAGAGINFFAVDWWPDRPQQDANLDKGLLQARNVNDIKFALFYETWDLTSAAVPGPTRMTPARRARLVQDMTALADRYFSHPSYLRVGGRPVMFWYLTRDMTGDVAGAVADVRRALRSRGYDVLLVGDEMFWHVTTLDGRQTTTPQVDRARLFDAVTAYNLYEGDNRTFAGYPSQSPFVAAASNLIARYRAALPGVPVIPSVVPGYNDRGVRLSSDHYAIPRQWQPGDDNGSTLRHMLDALAAPNLDPRLPMVLITSWNEWNEDTAIEPAPSPATSTDDSATGHDFTQGYSYGGGGTAELDAVRAFTRAQRGELHSLHVQ